MDSKRPTYNKNSRMKHYDIVFDESVQQNRVGFYNFNVEKRTDKSNDDTTFYVPKGMEYRLDLISVKFYGTAAYDWLIAEYNGIEDPIKDIVPGLKLIIPNRYKLGSV